MMEKIVKSFFANKEIKNDPEFENLFSQHLATEYSCEERLQLYDRFRLGESRFDYNMRRIILKSLAKKVGNDITIASGVLFIHVETVEIGNGVFIGANTVIQGRQNGSCAIGNKVWIGPQSYFDARDLIIEDNVGWGPGAKVLGSQHTGVPTEMPIINTDIIVKPVKICKNSDIGINAIIMPGVTIGESSIIGAGAVVLKDIPPYSIAVGIPADVKKIRKH